VFVDIYFYHIQITTTN